MLTARGILFLDRESDDALCQQHRLCRRRTRRRALRHCKSDVYRRQPVDLSQLCQPVYEAVQRNLRRRDGASECARLRRKALRADLRDAADSRRTGCSRPRAGKGCNGDQKRRFLIRARKTAYPRLQSVRPRRTPRCHRRTHRLRQDDAHQPAHALLRRGRGRNPRGRHRYPRYHEKKPAEKLRHGLAGNMAENGDRAREHRHRKTRRHR